MLTLFPDIAINESYRFPVSGGHEIYVEESGNREGLPVVVLHGGPGLGCSQYLRRFFDAERFRIIMIDQRGAGRSQPLARTVKNTTDHLVADIELVRQELGVERWMLFGYGWGAALGLRYAQLHTKSVLGVLLQGVMLAGEREAKWLFKDGCNCIFPDSWNEFVSLLEESERENVLASYAERLNGGNELVRMQSAKSWASWMARCSTLHPNQSVVDHYLSPHIALALAKLQCHYFTNKGFLAQDEILSGMGKLSGVPGVLVHGRYDMISPLGGALELQDAWKGSEIHIIRDAGHSIAEPAIVDALINSISKLLDRFEPQTA